MNMKRMTLTTKIPVVVLFATLPLIAGCTAYGGRSYEGGTYGGGNYGSGMYGSGNYGGRSYGRSYNNGGTGASLSGLGQIIENVGSMVAPNSSSAWRQAGSALNSTGRNIARQEAEERRRQEAEYARQRQIQEAERERQAYEAMTPEQKAEYQRAKQENQAAQTQFLLGVMGAVMSSGSGGASQSRGGVTPNEQAIRQEKENRRLQKVWSDAL
jgi:hypothetical protein